MKLEPLHPVQIARFREMTFQQKWFVAQGLHRLARETRLRVTRARHPEWTETRCQQSVAHEFIRART